MNQTQKVECTLKSHYNYMHVNATTTKIQIIYHSNS